MSLLINMGFFRFLSCLKRISGSRLDALLSALFTRDREMAVRSVREKYTGVGALSNRIKAVRADHCKVRLRYITYIGIILQYFTLGAARLRLGTILNGQKLSLNSVSVVFS